MPIGIDYLETNYLTSLYVIVLESLRYNAGKLGWVTVEAFADQRIGFRKSK